MIKSGKGRKDSKGGFARSDPLNQIGDDLYTAAVWCKGNDVMQSKSKTRERRES